MLAAGVLHAKMGPGAGPYDAHFVSGGIGINQQLPETSPVMGAYAPYTFVGWIHPDAIEPGAIVFAMDGTKRMLSLDSSGRLVLDTGAVQARSAGVIKLGTWSHVAVVVNNGRAQFYIDGKPQGSGPAQPVAVDDKVAVAPVVEGHPHLAATLVDFGVDDRAMTGAEVAAAATAPPAFSVVHIWQVGRGWPLQSKANIGLTRPQPAWTLPHGNTPPGAPVARAPRITPELLEVAAGRWRINDWTLAAAPGVKEDGARLSQPDKPGSGTWYKATVPGTVLQTLVDRGVYPDPYIGLNNMAIPESLARQDYWYRTQFEVPASAAGKRLSILLNGVNYSSEVWVNGKRLGGTRGAFIRGKFSFVPVAGKNAIAIKVCPPPHPGIPQEESIVAGPGENGGRMAIDGPTFVDTEGWDWIPGIRDRDTGLWQSVELVATGPVAIGDPQVITDLPLPRIDSADIYVNVPLTNHSDRAHTVTLDIAFDKVRLQRTITLAAHETRTESFDPRTDGSLHVLHPRLWWPNGYGKPVLHAMAITATVAGHVSDEHKLHFGIREVSYDLSLMDSKGDLRRVNVQTTNGKLEGHKLIDVTHHDIWKTPKGYAESLTRAGEHSSAVTPVTGYKFKYTHLTLRVNGVKIAVRGGNWGMDDAMKRSSRARLAPYFKLERESHINVIRNWMGTDTEPQFYDLADENGIMVMNDFWQSTQNFQVEPDNPQLFMRNARDVISRYRNHPSIILWFGRNEGVPYPLLNRELDDAVFKLDGTRWYTPSSNVVNLQYSGPYNYRPPVGYFTDLAQGFSVETGSPSLSTIESLEAMVPRADRWPISDTWAYHDWHFGGNGSVATFMKTLKERFGAATSLADFDRKAQMMNLETYKAIFEGMQAGLWDKDSGRMLWMTHPAWPSNNWQTYSWDYDTNASYYGVKNATQPVHIQLNLNNNKVVVVNTTRTAFKGLSATTRIFDLSGRQLWSRKDRLDAPVDNIVTLAVAPVEDLFRSNPMVLVEQKLRDSSGKLLSRNFYWRGRNAIAYRQLNKLSQVDLRGSVSPVRIHDGQRSMRVTLANHSATPALEAKLTLVDSAGQRILPAFYSDNYVSLLPGESRTLTIEWPPVDPHGQRATPVSAQVKLRGWNVRHKILEDAGKP